MIFIFWKFVTCFDAGYFTNRHTLEFVSKELNVVNDHQIFKRESIKIANTTFQNCNSVNNLFDYSAGGAIWAAECNLTIQNCYFISNVAQYASCLCTYGCQTSIIDSEFTDSYALNDIGAVWSMGSDKQLQECALKIDNTIFRNNIAGRYIGALASNLTNPIIRNCQFINNSAKNSVGACAIVYTYSFTVESVQFINNTSGEKFEESYSPALFLQNIQGIDEQRTFLQKCYFQNNYGSDKIKRGLSLMGTVKFTKFEFICFDGEEKDCIEDSSNSNKISQNFIHYNIESYEKCLEAFKTNGFTQSSDFTISSYFSETIKFTESNIFQKTNDFSSSNKFTNSQLFSHTLHFTNSNSFTKTIDFSVSHSFSSSQDLTTTFESNETSSSDEISESDESSSSEETSESSDSNEEEKEESIEEPDLNIPALAGGLSLLLLLLLLLLLIICCCCKKKKGCCSCGGKTKKTTKTIEKEILIVPRSYEYDENFATYPNPEYSNTFGTKENLL